MDEYKMTMMNEADLEEISGGAGVSSRKHVQIVNCKNCVNVRSTPSSASKDNKIGYAYLGDKYVFLGWSGNWAKIKFGGGIGYVFKDFVKIVNANA